MEIQIKLYKIFDNNKENTLSRLYSILGEDKIYSINKNLIAIRYDYSKCTLKKLKKILENIEIEEFTIINEIFYLILSKAIKERFIIQKINMRDSIDDFDDVIKECIDSITYDEIHMQDTIDNLIYELDWASKDEYIDINDVTIRIENDGLLTPLSINRSGEILLNLNILDKFKDLINN